MPSSRSAPSTTTVLPMGRSRCRLPAEPATSTWRTPRTMAPSSSRAAAGAPTVILAMATGTPCTSPLTMSPEDPLPPLLPSGTAGVSPSRLR